MIYYESDASRRAVVYDMRVRWICCHAYRHRRLLYCRYQGRVRNDKKPLKNYLWSLSHLLHGMYVGVFSLCGSTSWRNDQVCHKSAYLWVRLPNTSHKAQNHSFDFSFDKVHKRVYRSIDFRFFAPNFTLIRHFLRRCECYHSSTFDSQQISHFSRSIGK